MFMPALGLIRWMGVAGDERLVASPEGTAPDLARRLKRRVREAWRYRQALRELNRLDDRDLDDLALGRGDLPALARRHARAS